MKAVEAPGWFELMTCQQVADTLSYCTRLLYIKIVKGNVY